MTLRRLTTCALCAGAAAGAAGLAAAPADALYFGRGATVVSASLATQELADDRSLSVDVSRDGRSVAFDTRATNFFGGDDPDPRFTTPEGATVATDRLGGLFRRDLESGALELVADGDLVAEETGALLVAGARNPSISADGRYVAFATAQRLVPQDTDTPRHVDVYVRDMDVPLCRPLPECGPSPYTLVSALDGGDVPIAYAPAARPQASGDSGTDVWPGDAISDDGRRVLLRTPSDVPSDVGAGGQLLLRDLDARTTTLVTRRRTDGSAAGGAVGPATLSGDGRTAAWVGRNAGAQTRFQPGEASDPRLAFYLWQRVGEATRRPVGMADVDDPDCAPDTEIDFAEQVRQTPCYGPLASPEEERGPLSATAPALSADGDDVVVLTASGPRPGPTLSSAVDAYVADMEPGLSRKQGVRELTRDAVGDPAANAGIEAVALSPDGRHVVFATKRTRFLLPGFTLVGAARAQPLRRDLYLLDRQAGTIQRILTDLGGGDPDGDVDFSLAVSDGARRIAFVSAAANLFRGDANERADAFVLRDQPVPVEAEPAPEPPPVAVPEAVGEIVPDPPVLSVRVVKGKKTGQMVLEARPPAAGALDVAVSARLPGKDGKRSAATPITQLTRARARAKKPERVRITLSLKKPAHLALVRRLKALATTATVTWTPQDAGRKPLTRRATVRFVVVEAKPKGAKERAKKPSPKRSTGGRG